MTDDAISNGQKLSASGMNATPVPMIANEGTIDAFRPNRSIVIPAGMDMATSKIDETVRISPTWASDSPR